MHHRLEAGFGSCWILCQACFVVAPGTCNIFCLVWENRSPWWIPMSFTAWVWTSYQLEIALADTLWAIQFFGTFRSFPTWKKTCNPSCLPQGHAELFAMSLMPGLCGSWQPYSVPSRMIVWVVLCVKTTFHYFNDDVPLQVHLKCTYNLR